MMYIRVKQKSNNKLTIQIVESVRIGNTVSQKIVKHIGTVDANDTMMLGAIKRVAEDKLAALEQERKNQLELFSDLPTNSKGRKPRKEIKDILPTSQVSLDDIVEEKRIVEGVDEIAGKAYEEIGYGKLLPRGANQLLKDLVLARLVFPYSKHKLCKVLFEQFDKDYDLNRLYRLMDQIHPKINKIKQITCAKTQSLMPDCDVVLFDVTTLHFESIEADEFREFGYSKNFRFNTTQVVLALATNEHGMPIGYELFKGNEAEVKTLVASINSWKSLFNIKNVTFVGDRAMFSKDNLQLMDANGYSYVIAAKLRRLPQKVQDDILDENNYRLDFNNNSISWIGEFELNNQRLITTYTPSRARNDRNKRKQILDAIEPKTGNASKLIKNGAKKYVKVEAGNTSIDEAKVNKDAMWDGMHGIITNIKDKHAKELLAKYHSLWHIEEAFRINKTDLKMRPIYHWTSERIESHIAICYMSFAVLKYIQYKVEVTQIKFSVQDVLDVLMKVQASIHVHKVTKDKYRMPSSMSNNARCIYKAFDIERSLNASVYLP
ncbi:MAG: IS1634 family transposase [Neisseriaceae bacterium]|jgi:transposase